MILLINKTYYIRYFVPIYLQKVIHIKEIRKSLKTTSKYRSKLLHDMCIRYIEEIIFHWRYGMIDDNKLIEMIDYFKQHNIEDINKRYIEHPNPKLEQIHSEWLYDDYKTFYKECIYTEDYDNPKIQNDIDVILNHFKIKKDTLDSITLKKLSKEICLSNCGILDYMSKVFSGEIKVDSIYDIKSFYTNSIVKPIQTISNINTKTLSGITTDESWDLYITHKRDKQGIKESSIKGYNSARKYLEYFFDKTDDISKFKKKDFRNLQDKLIELPTRISIKEFKELSYDELIKIDRPKLNNKTINGKMVTYKDLFKFLIYEEYIKENPVHVNRLVEKDSNKIEYSVIDLQNIFNSKDLDDEIKDFCKIAIYTGMRIGELIELTKDNIIKEDNYEFFKINDGKTENAKRMVPIHPKIKSIVKYRLSLCNKYLFFDGNKNAIDKRINKNLRKIIIDTNKTFHSFRKNFTSKLYATSPKEESFIKVLIGHSIKQNITLSIYGSVQHKQLVSMIKKVDFDIDY
jgi:integrase